MAAPSRRMGTVACLLVAYLTLSLIPSALAFPLHTLPLLPNTSLPLPPPHITPSSGYILVLGSSGLIGSYLTSTLHSHHYHTILVHNRSHVDLRIPSSLPLYLSSLSIQPSQIAFAFFLACEVGGSKFLSSPSSSSLILHSNLALYSSLFPFLTSHSIPFLFTSSYLSHMATPYGTIKRLGEQLTALNPLGRTVRLWNVYGRERQGAKAHVMTDWVVECGKGRVVSRTDGKEWRQFLGGEEVGEGLMRMMEGWGEMEPVTDLSSGRWVEMREVGRIVSEVGGCEMEFGEGQGDRVEGVWRERVEPDMTRGWWRTVGWRPRGELREGVMKLFDWYRTEDSAGVGSERTEGRAAEEKNGTGFFVYPTSSAPPFSIRPIVELS